MIKDIIVHLEHQAARDPAHDFAVTIAGMFDAHLACKEGRAGHTTYWPG
jgi:hypothetical protein